MKVRDEYRPLDSLRPHPRNYNRHPDGQIGRMAEKVRTTAYTAPLVVTPEGLILGGHLRRLGLLKLRADSYPEPEGVRTGWEVPCRVVEASEVEQLALLAGDNPDPAELDYDDTALAAILAELQEHDLLAGSGYDESRLQALIDDLGGSNETSKEAPDEFPSYDESIEVEHECPKCGYRWSGGKTSVPGADDGGD